MTMKRIHLFETLLYVTILLVALCMPFFTDIFQYGGWSELLKKWLTLTPLVFIFLINNYIFVPRLLFTEKYLYYILSCILTVVAVVYFSYLLVDMIYSLQPPFDKMPPPDMPFPQGKVPPPDTFPFPRKDMPPRPGMGFPPMRQPLFFYFGQAMVSLLLIGFNVGVKYFIRWNGERERQSERERQYLQTELAFLKNQISPHFFMNTLNNIHSLIDIDTEKARNAIVKLSRLMRYMLYETDIQKVSLKKEIEFIESYIELMRLRYNENILTVETEYPAVTDNIFVPSFLFLSFIENAFKHGVDLHNHSLICLWITHENGRLAFTIRNRKSEKVSTIAEKSGIGLENVRKRLELIFKDDYTLRIPPDDMIFEVYLNIPV